MIIRKLEQSEHIATRKLWEEIFSEDTKAFLDYYYYIKAAKIKFTLWKRMGEFVQCFS